MKIKELHNYTQTQAELSLLLNYDDQVAKDASLIGICKSQEEYDTLCSAYRIPFALLSVNLADAGRYYATLPFEELTAISHSFELASDVKLSSQTDVDHIVTDKLLRLYADRQLGWNSDSNISEQVQAELISNASPYCYELSIPKMLKDLDKIVKSAKLSIQLSSLPEDNISAIYANCRDISRKGHLGDYAKEVEVLIANTSFLNTDDIHDHYLDFSKRKAAANLSTNPNSVDALYISILGFNRDDAVEILSPKGDMHRCLIDKIDACATVRKVGNFSFHIHSPNMSIACDDILDMFQNKMPSTACRQFYTSAGLSEIMDTLNAIQHLNATKAINVITKRYNIALNMQ